MGAQLWTWPCVIVATDAEDALLTFRREKTRPEREQSRNIITYTPGLIVQGAISHVFLSACDERSVPDTRLARTH